MSLALWHWGAFAALVVALLAIDLVAFARRDQEISFPARRRMEHRLDRARGRRSAG